jgi:phosphotriesterase-related protein
MNDFINFIKMKENQNIKSKNNKDYHNHKEEFIITVKGLIKKKFFNMVDAHTHVWIKNYTPELNNYSILEVDNFSLILEELTNFKMKLNGSLVDCTPYECGRDGNKLYEFSLKTGINIICVTGFHKRQYYPPNSKIWQMNLKEAQNFFLNECLEGLQETIKSEFKVKAGVIKIPFIGNFDDAQYKILTDAAIYTSIETNIPILVHTEQGLNIEYFTKYLESKKVNPSKVVLCHMDKRNDFNLHKELAKNGYFLEYDTFLREKYKPEENVWQLIQKMLNEGFEESIMIGTDIADNVMWEKFVANNGYFGFFNNIKNTALAKNLKLEAIDKIIGKNAANFFSVNKTN